MVGDKESKTVDGTVKNEAQSSNVIQRVCVFCGSHFGTDTAYRTAAVELSEVMVQRGLGLVYGGGEVGLMGVIADTVMAGGGEVIGVIPQSLFDREVAHQGITDLRVVKNMHERKHLLYSLGDAVIAMPGGIGTFEELLEALTWNQLAIHFKPAGLLNVDGYYDPLIEMLDRATNKGFLHPDHLRQMVVAENGAGLLDGLIQVRRTNYEKWVSARGEKRT